MKIDLIDTHAHFTKKYPYSLSDVEDQLERAREYGLGAIISVMAEPQGYQSAWEAAGEFPEIYLVLGISRHLALTTEEEHWERLVSYLEKMNPKIVGIGETGLDYRFSPDSKEVDRQKAVFIRQIELAEEFGLPLVIHSGKAMKDVLDIIETKYSSRLGGVIHFFTGDAEEAAKAIGMGFYLSFSLPLLTDHKIQKICAQVPLEWIVAETDSPFLKPPVGWPRKSSEPACVVEVIRKIAEIKKIPFEKAALATTRNAVSLFGIPS
jgi:TatD DNase family protein